MQNNYSYLWLVFFLFSFRLSALELTLAEAEIIAINNSFQLQNIQQSMAVTQLSHQLSLREFLPQISFTYNNSRQVRYNSTDTDSIQLGMTVNQPLFNGGRTLIQRELSSIQLSIQSAGFEKQVEEIMDQVWQLYYQVMIYQKKLKLQKELLELSQNQLIITSKRFDLGNITEIDLIESRIEVQGLEIEISSTRNAYQQLSSQFNKILGMDLKTELVLYPDIDPDYPGLPLDENHKDFFYNISLENNLDLKNARFELQKSKAQYNIATTSFVPKVSLEGSVNFSGESFPLQRPTFSAKLNIEFPFKAIPVTTSIALSTSGKEEYSNNKNFSVTPLNDLSFLVDRKSATIQIHQNLQKEIMLKDNLLFSIEQQLLDLKQKRSALKLNRMAYELQEQKLSILEAKNRLGEVKEIDLLKGNIEFYNQGIAIWEAILELLLSERSLEKTLGLSLGRLKEIKE